MHPSPTLANHEHRHVHTLSISLFAKTPQRASPLLTGTKASMERTCASVHAAAYTTRACTRCSTPADRDDPGALLHEGCMPHLAPVAEHIVTVPGQGVHPHQVGERHDVPAPHQHLCRVPKPAMGPASAEHCTVQRGFIVMFAASRHLLGPGGGHGGEYLLLRQVPP